MIGTSFLRVAAHDDDYSTNAAITYSMSEEQPEYLRVNPLTGWIYVNQPISQRTYISRQIIATDGGNRSSSVELAVTITNVKNQPPQWEKDKYEVIIPENTVRDTPVVTIKATSPLGDPRVTYNLEDGLVPESNMPVRFYLTPNREDGSASILVAEPLDYETTRNFMLRVRAQNVAPVPLAAFTTVHINITDVNDNVPFFTSSIYEASVTEGVEIGTLVLQVSANDLDLGLNGKISYSLLNDRSGDYQYFRIDPELGTIYTEAVFDRETKGSYLLEVKSVDGWESARPGKHGQPNSDTAYVRIFISDVNDNKPVFAQSVYEVDVDEDADVGSTILTVSANDEDEDTAYVRIFISDVNDNKPVFAQSVYEVDVDEDADVGSTILTVSANDEDEGANAKLRYQITSGNVGGVFDMEPEVGTIFIAQPLDYEQNKLYKLHVLASDGKWEDYATVIVTIVNKNDEAPVFSVNEYYGSVTEELDGSPVFVLQRTYISRQIIATDGGNRSSSVELAVTITNVKNQPPQWEKDKYEVIIPENTVRDTPVVVTASDPDKDADQEALRYSLHGQGAESEFIIDEVTGKIYAQRTLDREARAVWRFVVLATDEGGEGLTGFTDVIINVWDINDNAPIFACAPDSCHGDVAENSPSGTSVMEMTATDLDDAAVGQNAVLAYRIVGNAALNGANSGADVFSINPATGTVSVAMSGLDREQTDSYVLVVEARDGGGMIGTATATIHVTDVNDHVPRFLDRSCSIRIPESSEPNTPVIELSAEDADAGENGQLTFSVVAGDPEQKFYMVSHRQEQRGTLRLKKHLDYERPGEQRFNLTIKVEDMQYSSLLHCTLEVEDCNDHVPVFIPHFLQLPAVREDVVPGTSVASVAASDLDSGLNREITYSIAPESDPYHLFSVDQSGLVTVASELDREKVAQHHLVILATDHGTPPLTGTATIQMALLDVNDNGPEFEAAYAPIVWENVLGPQVVRLNQSSTLLRAVDRDSEENGSPFSFSVPLEYRYSNDFHLQDNGNDTATITALRAFDRERQKEFLLPVIMTDSGSPPKTVTNTLTITIGDENDHAHVAGQKKVFINCHRGRMPTNVLGKVYSPDPDDWDNKTYAFEGHVPNYFILNKRTGFLIIKENAPPGSYDFQVRVSDGVWPDAVSSVKVNVRELRDDAIYNSASLRLADISATEFMERRGNLKSRYELLGDFLSDMLSVGADDINIFSLVEVRRRTLDVRFSIHSTPFLRAERVHGYLAAHKQKLQSFLQVNVTQVHVDECVDADCRGGGGCTSHLSVTDKPAVVDSGSMALVSVTVEATAVCSCSAREHLHQSCSVYPRNPCHNGGVCVDTQSGYRCQCPAQFEGPECQQTKHSFHGNGYAWFPPIRPCFESHLSLEFITEVADGLLLYSGPLSQLQPWEPEDFMAIELIDGTPTLKINHGSGTLVLQLPGNVNVADRRWHRLDVRSNSKEVRFTLDRCAGATIMEMEGVGSWLTTEDHTSCEVTGITPNMDKHLNVTQVLQLGGVNENLPYIYPQLQHKHFTGCIRNLIVDSKIYQGLLSVFYNLGDGDFNLTMPSYRLDNGEWHEVHLDRHDNELTLRLDGGGGRREVTSSPGRSREIVIDPAVVMLGNSFPSGHNKSFQGCMRDLRLNGRFIPLDGQARDGVSVVLPLTSRQACPVLVLISFVSSLSVGHIGFPCPPGHMVKANSTGKFCVYTLCASRPCHRGTCVAQSPSKFTCHCPEGYRGRHCEVTLAIYRDDVGLSFSSLFAICICFMALLVLLLGIFLYTRWRSYKGLKEGVYHVSAHHDGWEDIRENVLNYDEEGGGEEDQNAYDMAELQKSLQPSPAQSVQYSRSRAIHHHPPSQQQQQHFCQPDPPSRAGTATTTTSSISSGTATIRRDVPPCRSPAQGQTANPSRAAQLARKSLSFSSQDLARYLCEIIRDADQHPETAPFDSLQVFSTEGGGSLAGSLSSFSSAGLEEGTAAGHECLKEWGPRFEKLKALYERAEGSDL
ncbi:neural-cadherin-like protein [Labeo rohita]|uniref:Neural-cadherin-like protein n=1 Tax=Labeo rohita TaxID=84645 RepID=A0A498NMN0_LABRO|nr:neural-cadherin-like protein [Labeo rohita]